MLAASIFGVRIPQGLRYGPGFLIPVGAASALLLLGLAGLSGNLYAIPAPFKSEFAALVAELMP